MFKRGKAKQHSRGFRLRLPQSAEWLVSAALLAADALIINMIFIGVFRIWLKDIDRSIYQNSYLQVRYQMLGLYIFFGAVFDIFRIRSLKAVSDIFSHVSAALLSTFLAFNLIIFLWRPLAALAHTFPRPIMLISMLCATIILFFLRVLTTRILKTHPILRRTIIVGDESDGKRIIKHFHHRGGVRLRLIEVIPSDAIDELASRVFFHHVHEVIITDPNLPLDRFWTHVFFHRKEEPHDFFLRICFNPALASGGVGLASLEDFPLISIPSLPLSPIQRWGKRGFDILFSLFALALTSPVMLLAAILIRLDSPGPIFYKQKRVGRYGKEFDMIKFRSMKIGAESGAGPQIATANDPRMTRLGGILRRLAIDELPQFFLVLIGEMSVVGPRPERPFFVKKYLEFQGRRLSVRPGVTGLAAVNARYYLRLVDKVGYDYYYLDQYSLILDIKIIFQTVWVLLVESDKALEDRHHVLDKPQISEPADKEDELRNS